MFCSFVPSIVPWCPCYVDSSYIFLQSPTMAALRNQDDRKWWKSWVYWVTGAKDEEFLLSYTILYINGSLTDVWTVHLWIPDRDRWDEMPTLSPSIPEPPQSRKKVSAKASRLPIPSPPPIRSLYNNGIYSHPLILVFSGAYYITGNDSELTNITAPCRRLLLPPGAIQSRGIHAGHRADKGVDWWTAELGMSPSFSTDMLSMLC